MPRDYIYIFQPSLNLNFRGSFFFQALVKVAGHRKGKSENS